MRLELKQAPAPAPPMHPAPAPTPAPPMHPATIPAGRVINVVSVDPLDMLAELTRRVGLLEAAQTNVQPSQPAPAAHPAAYYLERLAEAAGCTDASVRAMLAGKAERYADGRIGPPRGRQFAALRQLAAARGYSLTSDPVLLSMLLLASTVPGLTVYEAIIAGHDPAAR